MKITFSIKKIQSLYYMPDFALKKCTYADTLANRKLGRVGETYYRKVFTGNVEKDQRLEGISKGSQSNEDGAISIRQAIKHYNNALRLKGEKISDL
jgi:hypothetical protein